MAFANLQDEWNTLYREELPRLAKERSSVQREWPVFLDHCFSRIILDNAVGVDRAWPAAVKAPAVRNMSGDQFRRAIKLGRAIASGEADLQALDQQSLALRGKTKGPASRKRKQVDGELDPVVDDGAAQQPDEKKSKTRKGEMADVWAAFRTGSANEKRASGSDDEKDDETAKLERIREVIANDSSLTTFRRRVLTLLTQVPRGRWTTYKHLAEGVAKTSPQVKPDAKAVSSARAVGSAMRSNPFAPIAPCHRVLAADGKIGGFGGSWGEEGRFVNEKRSLLRSEGVRFDGKGRVVGTPFTGFH